MNEICRMAFVINKQIFPLHVRILYYQLRIYEMHSYLILNQIYKSKNTNFPLFGIIQAHDDQYYDLSIRNCMASKTEFSCECILDVD